ncbi:hypothetical protein BU26DRAFT_601954 [Trematosphaeria pertusa]|uniref:Uncharacterized protein n=1 Tax=Trematosphaeria pertusa TaxID=390896 RepID=A0A6A6IVH8_9PLEO|nr:uncharacterized protein BU26DRAFT_601954 [Trematosphaeria pertusa]KAF2253922.1 hypothetical protein BU26DRAFT_601954 [Trematosphaeria pertusa]
MDAPAARALGVTTESVPRCSGLLLPLAPTAIGPRQLQAPGQPNLNTIRRHCCITASRICHRNSPVPSSPHTSKGPPSGQLEFPQPSRTVSRMQRNGFCAATQLQASRTNDSAYSMLALTLSEIRLAGQIHPLGLKVRSKSKDCQVASSPLSAIGSASSIGCPLRGCCMLQQREK